MRAYIGEGREPARVRISHVFNEAICKECGIAVFGGIGGRVGKFTANWSVAVRERRKLNALCRKVVAPYLIV